MLRMLISSAILAQSVLATSIPVQLSFVNKKGEAHSQESVELRGEHHRYPIQLDGSGQSTARLEAGDRYQVWYQNFMGELEPCAQCQAIELPAQIDPNAEGSFKYWYDSKSIRLDIKFDLDRATLKKDPSTLAILDKTAKFLMESPNFVIEIAGHTDDQGNDAYNLKLSLARANTVRDYLIHLGVPASQLSAKGYGESSPLVSGTSPSARNANRRTEAIVLSQ